MDKLSDKITIGEKYGPAMEMTSEPQAHAYFQQLVEHTMSMKAVNALSREEAEEIERQNLGYYAGYYDNETRERVERIFKCKHPIFGSIAEKGPPTVEQALSAGMKMGEKIKKRN